MALRAVRLPLVELGLIVRIGKIAILSYPGTTPFIRVVEKPHNFDPTGGRKILLDFVVEKSQKFDAGHRAVHAVPQEHWRLENLCARTNPLYYERQLSIATSRFREAPPTVLEKYNRPRKLRRLC